jgi:hypothetical protein
MIALLLFVPIVAVALFVAFQAGRYRGSKEGFFRGRTAGLLSRDRVWMEAVGSYRWPVAIGVATLPALPADRESIRLAILKRFHEALSYDEATAVPAPERRPS